MNESFRAPEVLNDSFRTGAGTCAHHDDGGFTVWYERGGKAVGVLTHEADEDYERGRDLVRRGAPVPES